MVKQNPKKGFTLIEIIIVIFFLGILIVMAATAYTNSTGTFDFLLNYKKSVSSFQLARELAITNKDSENVDRYGIGFEENQLTVFADNGDIPLTLDGSDDVINECLFSDTPYLMEANGGGIAEGSYFFYKTGTGEFSAYYDDGFLIPKTPEDGFPYINIKFFDDEIERYILISQITGLVEEFEVDPLN